MEIENKIEFDKTKFLEELTALISKYGVDTKVNLQDYVIANYVAQTIDMLYNLNKNAAYFSNVLKGGTLDVRR